MMKPYVHCTPVDKVKRGYTHATIFVYITVIHKTE